MMLRPIALIVSMTMLLSGCGISNHDPQLYLRAYEAPRVPPAGTIPFRERLPTLGSTGFPRDLTLDKGFLERGRKLYQVNCSVCHGLDGSGEGIAALRGLTGVASLMEERIRTSTPDHLFEVMTKGYGLMPAFARRLQREERWAVAAYVKALQLSRRISIRRLKIIDRRYFREEMAP